jgi:hypothetical protein
MIQFGLNKQKCHFFSFTKLGNRRAEEVLPGGLVPVGGGGDRERLWGCEYGPNAVCSCM